MSILTSWNRHSFTPNQSLACAALIGALCLPAVASASCVNPAGTGGCFSTIGAAVAVAAPGGIINVSPGTYKEAVVIGKPLSLIGTNPANTIIDATGLPNPVYVDGLDNPGLHNVLVTGFTLENANFEGVLVTNASFIVINNNHVIDNNNSLSVDTGTCGIPDFEPGEQMDCGEGIHVMGVAYSTISGNLSTGNSGGILISDDTGQTHDNVFTNNNVHDNGFACGITLASHEPAIGSTAPHHGIVTTPSPETNPSTMAPVFPEQVQVSGHILERAPDPASTAETSSSNNQLIDNGLPGVAFHTHVGPNFGAPADNLSGNYILNNHISGNAADTEDTATPGPAGINVNSGGGGSPITGTIISGNVIENEAVDIVINTPAKVDAYFNDLLGGKIGVDNLGTGTVNAITNYWGCFAGPGATGCSTVSGPGVTFVPFLRIPAV